MIIIGCGQKTNDKIYIHMYTKYVIYTVYFCMCIYQGTAVLSNPPELWMYFGIYQKTKGRYLYFHMCSWGTILLLYS